MKIHPYAEMFPLLCQKELDELAEDIKANGLQEPIKVYQGKILDGRNRYKACQQAGVKPVTVELAMTDSEAFHYVISTNIKRRHLDASQRAAIGAKATGIFETLQAEARKKMSQAGKEGGKVGGRGRPKAENRGQAILPDPYSGQAKPASQARDELAQMVGASPRYVQDALKVREKDPELLGKVESGEIKLNQAIREVRRREKDKELEEAAAAATPTGAVDTWEILNGDCLDLMRSMDGGQIDLVFADPPYNIGIDYGEGTAYDKRPDDEYMVWVGEWLEQCYRLLKDDGTIWVMINDEYAAQYAIAMEKAGFHRRAWVKWYETFGVCNSAMNNFSRTSRHLFYCVKNRKQFTWNKEAVTTESARQAIYKDKRANAGGKVWDDVWEIPRLVGTSNERLSDFPTQLPIALLLPIVGACSNQGGKVLDPFSGSGTTGAACLTLGRYYVGLERSSKFSGLSIKRLKSMEVGR